tara:strand:+ start:195 stop:341 length:147 start_codon:yes stop_codon:yes gene_type:complete
MVIVYAAKSVFRLKASHYDRQFAIAAIAAIELARCSVRIYGLRLTSCR